MSEKLEYDSTLGGPVVLGTHMPTFKYAASALKELKELVNANKQCNSNKLIFQTLPKHMRRRAMSHHPKRLPRKYRAAHIHQMSKSGKPHASKRPSRKHRRRPHNLLKDYLRRQRRFKWMETHIWHAKRFHMVEKWGYKLPYSSCDKTYRACYRATTDHCLLQDISFYACVEIKGTLQELSHGFEKITSKECGLTLTAKTYINGRREGSIDIFMAEKYPYNALGKATFLWRYEEINEEKDDKRTLWLWLHPVAYNATLEEIIKVFNLIRESKDINQHYVEPFTMGASNHSQETSIENNIKKIPMKKQRRLQFTTKTSIRCSIPQYKNSNGSIELKELKNTLNRFRLTGPLAQSILNNAFQVRSLTKEMSKDTHWITKAKEYSAEFLTHHAKQELFWKKCHNSITSPAELLSNMVLGLNIEDPRIHRPQKRSKPLCKLREKDLHELHDILADITPELSFSALWCEPLRNHVSNEMLSTHDYCCLRAKNVVVPGKSSRIEDTMQPIPILLIQRPGCGNATYERLGYGCGWDVIAPAGYGMPIWISLIMWGARPGGLRELKLVANEMGTEEHLPDTVAGAHTVSDNYNKLISKYFRLPPNKRCNYTKLAIVSPFRIPFQHLIRDWSPIISSEIKETQKYFVLRERQQLQYLDECVKKCSLLQFPNNLSKESLVQVKVTMKSRGNPKEFSLICLPIKKDFKRNLKQITSNNKEPVFVEPLLSDPNEKERYNLRLQHKKLLKRLRAKRVREKRKTQETSCTKVYITPAGTSALCLKQFKNMCNLWLPQDTSTLFSVRKQGTRECFGYASSASFCLTEGAVRAIAYVTIEGLKQLIKLCQKSRLKQLVCLIRSTNSRTYRFAKIQINLQI